MERSSHRELGGAAWICGLVTMVGVLTACSSTENVATTAEGGVESRGVGQMQRQVKQGVPVQPGGASQANVQAPKFPQKFEVQGPEAASFGFAVTQPGPIALDIQAQGAPLLVTLLPPGGQPATQPATGALRMNYSATAQDVQRSPFWSIQIRLAQPMPPQQGGRASGTINVQHPPVNQAQVQSAIAAQQQTLQQGAAARQSQEQQAASQIGAQLEQAFLQRKAHFEQQQQQARANQLAQIQPQLDQLRSRMGGSPGGQSPAWTKGGGASVGSTAGDQVQPRGLESDVPQTPEEGVAAGEGTDDISSRGGLRLRAYGGMTLQPNPVIASLSVGQGQPGDPLFINGSNFGTAGGEVHFVIAPGKDLQAPPGLVWTDNQIFATVPDATGVMGFSGTVYIKRAGETVTSNLAPFRFEPMQEIRDYKIPPYVSDHVYQVEPSFAWSSHIAQVGSDLFQGKQGTNEYYVNTRLKNGWVLDEVYYWPLSSGSGGGSYLQEKRIGSSQPYFSIRVWVNAGFNWHSYKVDRISVRGPKGLPDGLVVP
ncbi:MAG: exported protein of unknown function [Nitrospira sp.]